METARCGGFEVRVIMVAVWVANFKSGTTPAFL
jgi:hypothetical protein